MRLQPAARADAEQLLDAELDELLEDDRRAGAAHARPLHRDRLPFPGARVAEQAALGVPLLDVVEVRLGDVLRAQRVAGKEACLRVVARLGPHVDRHPRNPIGQDPGDGAAGGADAGADPRLLRRGPRRARLPRGRRAAADRPLLGVVDRGGRLAALCHTGANVVPSGRGLRRVRGRRRALEGADADRRAGRGDGAVGGAARTACRRSARIGRASPCSSIERGARARRHRPARRDGRAIWSCCCPRARPRTSSSSASTRSGRTPTASAGARAPRSRMGARGSGRRTASSSSRPRRPRGRRRPCSCSRCGPTRRRAGEATPRAASADLIRLLLERVPRVCLFVRAENTEAIRLYERVGMRHVLDYRSVLL